MATCIGQVEPPELDQLEVNFLVTHVDTPNSFWVNYSGQKYDQLADEVQDSINVWLK